MWKQRYSSIIERLQIIKTFITPNIKNDSSLIGRIHLLLPYFDILYRNIPIYRLEEVESIIYAWKDKKSNTKKDKKDKKVLIKKSHHFF